MEISEIGGLKGLSVRQELCEGRTGRTKCGVYLLASSLAAALLDGIFEHPAGGLLPLGLS